MRVCPCFTSQAIENLHILGQSKAFLKFEILKQLHACFFYSIYKQHSERPRGIYILLNTPHIFNIYYQKFL